MEQIVGRVRLDRLVAEEEARELVTLADVFA